MMLHDHVAVDVLQFLTETSSSACDNSDTVIESESHVWSVISYRTEKNNEL